MQVRPLSCVPFREFRAMDKTHLLDKSWKVSVTKPTMTNSNIRGLPLKPKDGIERHH
jgi:hypothetical protein